jgi:cytochrome c oxidase subunit 2
MVVLMLPRTFVLAAAFVLLASSGAVPETQATGPRVIEVTAERFEFWPPEIALAQGEEVEFRIRSMDTVHGFRVLGTATNLQVPKRGKGYASIRFTAGSEGRYTFECSRMCGAGHQFMRGLLVVRAPRKP